MQMRLYHADFAASFHDIRNPDRGFADLYDPDTYDRSQTFGHALLESGSNGVVYRSVRHEGGESLACFRPALTRNVRVAAHYDYRWEGTSTPRVIRLQN